METPDNVNDNVSSGYNPHSTAGNTFFNKTEFDGAINDRGYNCTTKKAYQCPCKDVNTGSTLASCQNCGGTGWFYVDVRNKVRVVMQQMAYTNKYFNWTQANMATARATIWDIEKLSFMDKIIIEDTTTIYTQLLKLHNLYKKTFAYTIYPIQDIEAIFAFIAPNQPLKKLEFGKDYTFEKGKNVLYFDEKLLSLSSNAMTIRYKHHPEYVVFDILRDVIQNKVTKVGVTEPVLENLPYSYVCRRLHFALPTNFLGNSPIIENG